MLEKLKGVAVFFAVAFVASNTALYILQEQFIFPAPSVDIGSRQIADFAPVSISTRDGETLFTLHHPAQPGEATLLVFHGNGDAAILQEAKGRKLVKAGFGVLLVEYRGYPGSTGKPSEKGFRIDAKAAYDFVASGSESPIGVYAHSLGTGVAVRLATDRKIFAMVLEAPFDSLKAIVQNTVPWVPVNLLLKHKFESDKLISTLNIPMLILHGERDKVVPIEHGRALYRKAPSGTKFIAVANAGHNNLPQYGSIEKAIEFFNQAKWLEN